MLRWIYPVTCSVCGDAAQQSVCETCLEQLARVPHPICLYCGAATRGLATTPDSCEHCQDEAKVYDWARSGVILEGHTRQLVHDLKYHGASYLAAPLARILYEIWQETPRLRTAQEWGLVPVPIDYRRSHERGYNQAELLARELSMLVGHPVLQPLMRQLTDEENRSMTRMSARARQQQANKVYTMAPHIMQQSKKWPAHLVLIDDVYTTGATARACAKILRDLPGVQEIGILTLSRAM